MNVTQIIVLLVVIFALLIYIRATFPNVAKAINGVAGCVAGVQDNLKNPLCWVMDAGATAIGAKYVSGAYKNFKAGRSLNDAKGVEEAEAEATEAAEAAEAAEGAAEGADVAAETEEGIADFIETLGGLVA